MESEDRLTNTDRWRDGEKTWRDGEKTMTLDRQLLTVGGQLLRGAPASPVLAFAAGVLFGAAVAVVVFRTVAEGR